MCSREQNAERIYFTVTKKCTDVQQTVISFRCHESCDEKRVEENYKNIVGSILDGRDVVVVTKEEQLKDLISADVQASDVEYVTGAAVPAGSFTPRPQSEVTHHAALVRQLPRAVAEDLATTSQFVYGNLWFVIPHGDDEPGCRARELVADVRQLTPSSFSRPPLLRHEAIASPAMYDGLEMLWFNPNEHILLDQFGHLYKQ